MKKIILAIMAIVISASAAIAQEPMSGYYAVTTTIKIRSAPSVKSEALMFEGPEEDFPANFLRGSIVNVIEDKGEWVKVKIYNTNCIVKPSTRDYVTFGYIMKKFLTTPDPIPAEWYKEEFLQCIGCDTFTFTVKDGNITGPNEESVSIDKSRNIIFMGDLSSPYSARTICYLNGKSYYRELYFFM